MQVSNSPPSSSPAPVSSLVRWAILAYALTGVLGIIGSLMPPAPDGVPPGPAAFWLGRAWGWWVAVSTVLVTLGLGRLCMRIKAARTLDGSGWTGGITRFVVGSFALYLCLTLLALTGGMASPMARLGLAAVCAVGLVGVWSWLREQRSEGAADASTDPAPIAPWLKRTLVTMIVLWVLPFLVQTLLPDTEWDVPAYHLPQARTLLTQGLWAVDPVVSHFAFPALVHLVYAAMLSVNAGTAIIPFNLLASFGAVAAAYTLALEMWGRRAGQWAALVCLATNILWEVGLTAQIDNVLAMYCILGYLAALRWVRDSSRTAMLVPAAMSMGFAMGTKYTGVAFAGILGLGVLVIAVMRIRGRVRPTLVALALAVPFLLFPSGLWYLRNAIVLGDPVHPFLHGPVYVDTDGRFRRLVPEVDRLIATSPLASGLDASPIILGVDLSTARKPQSERLVLNVWDVLLHPDDHARKPLLWLSPFLVLFLALPLAIRGRQDSATWWFYALGLVTGLGAAAVVNETRYVLPVAPLWACGAGMVLAALPRVPRLGRALVWVALLLLGLQLMINSGLETQKVLRTRPQAFLTGQETDIDWLQRVGYNNTLNAVVLAQWVNREIRDGRMPADSIMFLVGESKGDLLNARFMPDNGPEAYPWLAELVKAGGDPSRVIASFHERGINYVAINPAYLQWTLRYLDLRRDHQAFALATLREALYPYQDSVIRVATTFIFDLGRTPR